MTDRPFIPSGDPAPRDPRELPLLVSGGIGGAPVGPPAPRWRVLLRFLFGGRLRRDVLEALEERWLNADDDVRYELNRLPRPATMRRRIRRLFRREQ